MAPAVSNSQPRIRYSLRKLARGSGSRVLRMVIGAALGFFLTPFMIHHLGSEQYGIWATAGAFVGYYSFLDLGLSGAVFTHMARAFGRDDREEARFIYAAGVRIFGAVSLILTLATLVLSAAVYLLHYTHGVVLAEVILITGLGTASAFGMRVPFGTLNAGQHFDITAWVLIFSSVLRAIGIVIVLNLHYGVVGLAWLILVSGIPSNIFIVWMVHRKYPFLKIFSWPPWNGPIASKLFHFGGWVMVGQIADRIRFQADTLVVSFFIGLVAVTHYSIGSTLAMYYYDIVGAMLGVLYPLLSMQQSVNDQEGFKLSFFSGTRVGLAVSSFMVFGMLAWSKDFITRWMGGRFDDAYPVVAILSVAIFLETSQTTSVSSLFASLHHKAYAALNVSEAVSNLVLSLLLVKPLGMVGVAVGTLIPSIVFRGIIQPIVVERILHISMKETIHLYLRTGSRCAAFLVIPWVITHYGLAPDYPHLFAVGALSAIAYGIPIWWLEFHAIGASQIRGSMRNVRRLLFAR